MLQVKIESTIAEIENVKIWGPGYTTGESIAHLISVVTQTRTTLTVFVEFFDIGVRLIPIRVAFNHNVFRSWPSEPSGVDNPVTVACHDALPCKLTILPAMKKNSLDSLTRFIQAARLVLFVTGCNYEQDII